MSIFGPEILLYNTEKFFINKNHGQLLTHEEWEKIKESMDNFYLNYNEKDLIELNEKKLEEIHNEMKSYASQPQFRKKIKPGCVYFIGAEEVGVKIGYSTNVKGRLKTLNLASPYKLELLKTIDCSNYVEVEKWAHQYFEPRKMHSEWFDITLEEIEIWVGGLTRG